MADYEELRKALAAHDRMRGLDPDDLYCVNGHTIKKSTIQTLLEECDALKHDIESYVEASTGLATENERLRARLEIDPGHSVDGIDARDETIRGQDRVIDEQRSRIDGLTEQHHRDSANLRALCAERDALRKALADIAVTAHRDGEMTDSGILTKNKETADVAAAIRVVEAAGFRVVAGRAG